MPALPAVIRPPLGGYPISNFIVREDYRDLTPGDYDAPVFSLGGQDNYAFSPDGQEICYTSNHDKNPSGFHQQRSVDRPGQRKAKPKNITADNPASDSTPLYSPDGRYIAYRAQQRPGYESDRFRLMLYDRKTGEKKNLTEDFDRWVGTFAWSPDSNEFIFAHRRCEATSTVSFCTDRPLDAFNPADDDDRTTADDFTLTASGTENVVSTTISSNSDGKTSILPDVDSVSKRDVQSLIRASVPDRFQSSKR